MTNGGKRQGAGRKPKAEEIELIQRLSPMDAAALNALKMGLANGEYNFVKLFMEYRFGKPKEKLELSGELAVLWNEVKTYGSNDQTNQVP